MNRNVESIQTHPAYEPGGKRSRMPYHRVMGRRFLILVIFTTSIIALIDVLTEATGGTLAMFRPSLLMMTPLFLGLSVYHYERLRKPTAPQWRAYIHIYLAFIIFMTIWGVIFGNPILLITFDLMNYSVTLCGFILARRDEVWEDIKWPVLIFGSIVLLLAFRYTNPLAALNRSLVRSQSSYTTQGGYVLLPLFLLIAAQDVGLYFFLSAISTTGILGLMLVFQKRAPAARIALYLAFAVWLSSRGRGALKRLTLLALAGVLCLALLAPFVELGTAYTNTMNRFVGHSEAAEEISFSDSNYRLYEVIYLFKGLDPAEWLVGKGIGGYFTESPLNIWDEVSEDVKGRISTHIGLPFPILKGGIFWWIVYYLPLFLLLANVGKTDSQDKITRSCIYGGIIYLAFQLMESTPDTSSLQLSLYFGLVSGRYQNIRWTRKKRLLRRDSHAVTVERSSATGDEDAGSQVQA